MCVEGRDDGRDDDEPAGTRTWRAASQPDLQRGSVAAGCGAPRAGLDAPALHCSLRAALVLEEE